MQLASISSPARLPIALPPTLADVSRALRADPSSLAHTARSVLANHLPAFFGTNEFTLEQLVNINPQFGAYLVNRHYPPATVQRYSREAVSKILRTAEALGWVSPLRAATEAWEAIAAALPTGRGARDIVKLAIRHNIGPEEFDEIQLARCQQFLKEEGRRLSTIQRVPSEFRRAVRAAHLEALLPKLDCQLSQPTAYGVPVDRFPEPLRSEVRGMLAQNQQPMARVRRSTRKRRKPLRAVSVERLRKFICGLFGFIVNIERAPAPRKLAELIAEDHVWNFALWLINDRKIGGYNVASSLGQLRAAVQDYPPLANGYDFGWFDDVIDAVPEDPASKRRERKAAKLVSYTELAVIPRRIEERSNHALSLQ